MGLESGSFLEDLVAANPDGADGKAEGDNHLRLLKTVLKATFPGMVGRAWRHQDKSSGYTVVANDNMSLLNCTTALTLAFAAAATLGNGHMILVHANGGDVTLDPNGAETVNGGATLVIPNGMCAVIMCSGTLIKAFLIPTVSPWTTGDVKISYKPTGSSPDVGWVWMLDGTIGNGSSSATARAHEDTRALFTLLWNGTANADCAVLPSGRGANATDDFNANKTIALPKVLGRELAIAGAGSGLTSRALASVLGTESVTVAQANLPNVTLNVPAAGLTGTAPTKIGGSTLGMVDNGFAIEGTGYRNEEPFDEIAVSSTIPLSFGGSLTTAALGSGSTLGVMTPRAHANVMIKL